MIVLCNYGDYKMGMLIFAGPYLILFQTLLKQELTLGGGRKCSTGIIVFKICENAVNPFKRFKAFKIISKELLNCIISLTHLLGIWEAQWWSGS